MRILIAAVGKSRRGGEQSLYEEYVKRTPWKIDCREIESKQRLPELRKQQENTLLREACHGYERWIALDEMGKNLSSREFADTITKWQQQGFSSIAFIIGGADGLNDETRKTAHLTLSFGRATWPHMLVRALLAEQLYRCHSVIAGHPYHRD